jgi:hypothetical protein
LASAAVALEAIDVEIVVEQSVDAIVLRLLV